ncbi:hypothetical protein, partial [Bacillus paralicheniformis]|uniref:hypothetical protein n=1 Tax=Bacillus paralicheniformis TaxID=1648923 RepID=UPI002282DD03
SPCQKGKIIPLRGTNFPPEGKIEKEPKNMKKPRRIRRKSNEMYIIQVFYSFGKGQECAADVKGLFKDLKEANNEAITIKENYLNEKYASKNNLDFDVLEDKNGPYYCNISDDENSWNVMVIDEYCK